MRRSFLRIARHGISKQYGGGGHVTGSSRCALSWKRSIGFLQACRCLSSTASDTIFKSPHPDQELPVATLSDYMFSRFSKFGDKTALVDDATGRSYKYSEIQPLARSIGSFLTKLGYQKGDVLCYYGTNNTEFALLFLGCSTVGVVLTTANPAYTSDELSTQMKHSGAKAVVTVPALVPKAREAGFQDITVIGGSVEGCRDFTKLLEDDASAFPDNIIINPKEDLAVLPYSSGTTGLPKGVMLTHFNIVANLVQFRDAIKTYPEDTNFGVLPFYHIYGMAPVLFGTLQEGATMVTTPGFEPEGFLKALMKHKVTQLHIVPPIVLFLARHPVVDKFDLSAIRHVVSAAAPLGEGLTLEFTEKRKTTIIQGYGLTETSPVVSLDNQPITVGSIGRLIPNTEAMIVDPDTGKSLNRNEVGEICIRGPQNMKGYLNNEKATRDMIDSDGWLHTGDIGHMRDNDCLVITDRLKELIKYKGLQVAPAELEDLLHQHPDVQDVAVIGIPDDRAGELPKAFVVPKPNAKVTEPELLKFVEDRVSEHKQLKGGVEFRTEIPKSPSGKILRRFLRE